MKITFRRPTTEAIAHWLDQQKGKLLTYPHPKATQQAQFPEGYVHDRNSCLLGQGDQVYEHAKEAIRQWIMFPKKWIINYPSPLPFREHAVVAVVVRLWGMYWFNSCRIVYLIDEENRFGFAYGTLPQHAESGEEVFWVERRPNGEIWYCVEAFSRHAAWWLKLGSPFVRNIQKQFAKDSMRDMQNFVKNKG